MTNSVKDIETKTDETNTGYVDPDKKPEEGEKAPEGDTTIPDMYSTPEDGEKTPEEKKAIEDKKIADEKEAADKEPVKDPVTGYDKDIPKPKEEEDPDKKPEEGEKAPEVLKKEEVDTALKELPEGYSKESVSKFALDNKMNKEQIEAYVKFVNAEDQQLKKDQESQLLNTRIEWQDELRDDKEFGGEFFAKNVHDVEKVIDNHMPDTKKVLTDRGSMMPPYIMKDLFRISKLLNPKTTLVNGESSKVEPKEKEGEFLDTMYK